MVVQKLHKRTAGRGHARLDLGWIAASHARFA